jgi:hypothetical protein
MANRDASWLYAQIAAEFWSVCAESQLTQKTVNPTSILTLAAAAE